ncbi:hypothetical protein E2C01_083809 [Portunus trituberculatus]|uniref:Uncharacterized protein n=1 Tax=Portunus trituberculatus TaxID=210409 RepID=A0A5B7J4M2_PORTR|nr:hypothetical protein [Portunus trituberculatus]
MAWLGCRFSFGCGCFGGRVLLFLGLGWCNPAFIVCWWRFDRRTWLVGVAAFYVDERVFFLVINDGLHLFCLDFAAR